MKNLLMIYPGNERTASLEENIVEQIKKAGYENIVNVKEILSSSEADNYIDSESLLMKYYKEPNTAFLVDGSKPINVSLVDKVSENSNLDAPSCITLTPSLENNQFNIRCWNEPCVNLDISENIEELYGNDMASIKSKNEYLRDTGEKKCIAEALISDNVYYYRDERQEISDLRNSMHFANTINKIKYIPDNQRETIVPVISALLTEAACNMSSEQKEQQAYLDIASSFITEETSADISKVAWIAYNRPLIESTIENNSAADIKTLFNQICTGGISFDDLTHVTNMLDKINANIELKEDEIVQLHNMVESYNTPLISYIPDEIALKELLITNKCEMESKDSQYAALAVNLVSNFENLLEESDYEKYTNKFEEIAEKSMECYEKKDNEVVESILIDLSRFIDLGAEKGLLPVATVLSISEVATESTFSSTSFMSRAQSEASNRVKNIDNNDEYHDNREFEKPDGSYLDSTSFNMSQLQMVSDDIYEDDNEEIEEDEEFEL